jgi:phage tail sheath protein FI
MTVKITYPGVYVEELPANVQPIPGVSTSQTAFVDFFASGPLHKATPVASFAEFAQIFGGLDARSEASYAVQQFFLNGGSEASVVRVSAAHEPTSAEWKNSEGAEAILGRGDKSGGIYALRGTGFNLLCLPAAANLSANSLKMVYDAAAQFCNEERAFLIVDIPPDVDTTTKVIHWLDRANPDAITRDQNAAVYFPRLLMPDPLNKDIPRNVGASGTMAGIYARTDAKLGVWKAPAGTDAALHGVTLAARISDNDNGKINPLAINALRNFPIYGNVCWGARTLAGSDVDASEWKYIPVRRLTLFIEESIYRGTQWVVFEPNAEPLWSTIRLQVGAFMQSLFRQGAFPGRTPSEAYFVQCDRTTITQDDLDQGVVNVIIGLAPLKPAEFVIIRIQQMSRRCEE